MITFTKSIYLFFHFQSRNTIESNTKAKIKGDEGIGVTDVTLDVNHVHEDTTTENPLELGKNMHRKY